MKKLRLLAVLAAIVAVGCQQENFDEVVLPDNDTIAVEQSGFRSYDEALEIAENSIRLIEGKDVTRSTMKRRIIKNNVQTIRSNATRSGNTSDDPVAYVVNFEDNQGFAVIAANEQINPLIAVTESGNYTYGEPTGVEAFDDYMDNAISTLAIVHPPITLPDDPITPTPGLIADTVDIFSRVDPLLTTRWDQGGIYGAYCPNGLCGCAATAFGQIMTYHRHPFSISYTFKSIPISTYLNWDNIAKHDFGGYASNVCSCGCNYSSIGNILREVGERFDMRYHTAEPSDESVWSGTNNEDIAAGISTLGYQTPTLLNNFSDSDRDLVFSNLDNHYPVIITGESQNSGHAWVIDGYHNESSGLRYYKSNPLYDPHNPSSSQPEYVFFFSTVVTTRMYHYNWGNSGICNGWFNLGIYDMNNGVEYDLMNGYYGNYNLKPAIIYNIIPNN